MTELNNLNDSNNIKKEEEFNQTTETQEINEINQTNDEFTQKIFELELIIKEKEEIIYTLQSKIKEFSTNIEQLKKENEKLKSKIASIEKEINTNNQFQNYNILQMQQTQRFLVCQNSISNISETQYNNNDSLYDKYINDNSSQIINELYSDDNYNDMQNEFINENFKSKIIPFKMKPFQTFDHKKLNINYNINKNEDNKKENKLFNNDKVINSINEKNLYIKNQINSNISMLEKEKDFKNNSKMENSINNKAEIKLHSSMFFQKCKKIMSKFDYKKLLEIVKLSNLKTISREDTYLRITSLLDDNYPQLSNEFKLLFV